MGDSGCNSVAVKIAFVPNDKVTHVARLRFLIENTVSYLSEAEVIIRTPYCIRQDVGSYIDTRLHDLVLGNIPGARDMKNPVRDWGNYKSIAESEIVSNNNVTEQSVPLQKRV